MVTAEGEDHREMDGMEGIEGPLMAGPEGEGLVEGAGTPEMGGMATFHEKYRERIMGEIERVTARVDGTGRDETAI